MLQIDKRQKAISINSFRGLFKAFLPSYGFYDIKSITINSTVLINHFNPVKKE